MRQNKFVSYFQTQDGAISIFMVILIPVIIIGSFLIFQLVESYKRENDMQKIAHATSDAILSKYSGVMMSRFGMLASPIDQPFESIVQKYAALNDISGTAQPPEVIVAFNKISSSEYFSKALKQAAISSKCISLVEYGTTLLEQNKTYAKLQANVKTLQSYEKKAFERLDFEDVEKTLKSINAFGSISDIQNQVNHLLQEIDSFDDMFEMDYQELEMMLESLYTIEDNNETATFYAGLKESYSEGKKDFNLKMDQITLILESVSKNANTLSDVEVSIRENLNIIDAYNREMNELYETLKRLEKDEDNIEPSDPSNEEEKEDLVAVINDRIEQIEEDTIALVEQNDLLSQTSNAIRQEIDNILSQFVNQHQKSLYLKILDTMTRLDELFESVNIEDKAIALNESDDFRTIEDRVNYDLTTKILVSEYLLSIFSSFDLNCPRKIPYGERLNEERSIKGEIEFILTGLENQRQSLAEVKLKVLGIRLPFNLASLIQSKSQMNQINVLTAPIPQPWRIFAYSSAITLWSVAESYTDVNELLKGNAIPLIKRSEEWHTSLNGLLSQDGVTDGINALEKQNNTQYGIYYMDYLRLLLYLQDESKTVNRTMSLFAHELSSLEHKSSLSDYSIGHELQIIWTDESGFHQHMRQYLLVNQLTE